MSETLYVPIGAIVAIAIDWAIYTHLSAYLRASFPNIGHHSYREMSLGNPTTLLRTVAVFVTGLAGGLAFATKHPLLWLIAVSLFAVTHSLIYALLHRRGKRP